MNKSNIRIGIWSILIFCSVAGAAQPGENGEKWNSLFNGENIDDWDPKFAGYELGHNYKNTFVAEDGLLRVKYDEYESFKNEFGHLFHRVPYSYYRLRIVYRFIDNQVNSGPGWAFRNNGMMLHSQSAESMGIDQDFPISIEAQLLGSTEKVERTNLNLCTPGTHVTMNGKLIKQHCINSSSKMYYGDAWVTAEFVVLGDSIIHHIIEDDTVLTYTKPIVAGGNANNLKEGVSLDGRALTSGYIAIQAESHPTDFKTIELLNLTGCMDPAAENFRSYYVKSDKSKCNYQ